MYPRVYGAIARPRVLHRLGAALQHGVMVVSAPPGYGKTTAVSQFVQTLDLPVAWHTLQTEEHDIANLYAHALRALGLISPAITDRLPPPYGYSPPELAALIAAHLADEPALQETEFVYVLDDLHLIDSLSTTSWLDTLVRRFPPNGHLILISRNRPPLSYIELTSRNQVTGCGAADLRLDRDEVAALATARGVSLDPALVERLDGWPAGIALALRDGDRSAPLQDSPDQLFEQLATALLDEQPVELQDFLLVSSTLKIMTPDGLDWLGRGDSFRQIEVIQNRNLFLSRVEDGWSYHTLFRELLQTCLRERDPERWRDLHLQAARWLETRDRIEQAVEHYIEADAFVLMAALVERVSTEFFRLGKFDTLLAWDDRLAQAGAAAPHLTYICGLIHIDRYQHEAARERLQRAERAFKEAGDDEGLANAQLKHGWIRLRDGAYQPALALASRFVGHPSAGVRGNAYRLAGLAHLHLGDIAPSLSYLEQAAPLFRSTPALQPGLSHVLQDLSLACVRAGRLDDAGALLQEVVALRRQAGGQAALALALNNLGYHYHQQSDYADALSTLREGTSLAARTFDVRVEGYLLWSLGDVLRDVSLFDEARTAYDRALRLVTTDHEPHLAVGLMVSKSTLLRWQGELEEAIMLAERAHRLAGNIALEGTRASAARWAARAQLGAAKQALDGLQAAAAEFIRQGAGSELARVWGMCAGASLLCGDRAAARDFLRRAEAAAASVGSGQLLAAEIGWTPGLESLAASLRGDSLLASDLEQLRHVRQQMAATSVEVAADEPVIFLRVRTMGHPVVECNGREIPPSAWRTARASELFFLLLFGPRRKEEICLLFWPDSSAVAARTNFHTVLGRLRDAVGKTAVVFSDGLYRLNPEVPLECDAFEFERIVNRARSLPYYDARAEDLWRRASALYRGEFLASVDSLWAVARRQDYREMALEARVGLGRCAQARGDHRAAVERLVEAIALDPLNEEAYRALMTSYAALGEKARVRETYDRLCAVLDEELGAEPSETTAELARQLLG